jgi:predicted nucleotidyltransferase
MSVQQLQARLAGMVTNLPDVRLVYLFGSRVHEPVGPMSDYDIAVLVARDADEGPILAQLGHELARALGTDRIDVVSLRRAPIELAYAIIARGEVLYQRDVATRVEYEAGVMGRYGDFLPVLCAQREDILRGDEHGHRVQRYRAALGRTERTIGQIAAAAGQTKDRV